MTRQTRILVTVAAIGIAGVGALSYVARQYRGRLASGAAATGSPTAGSEDAAARAGRLVDGFLAARQAAKAVTDRYPGKMKQLTAIVTGDFTGVEGKRMGTDIDAVGAYRIERYNAFTAHGMTFDDYAAVRTAWRAFEEGKPVADPALAAALEAKKSELGAASLGPYEPFDDVIK